MAAGGGGGFVHRRLHLKSTRNDVDAGLAFSKVYKQALGHWLLFSSKQVPCSAFESHLPLVGF